MKVSWGLRDFLRLSQEFTALCFMFLRGAVGCSLGFGAILSGFSSKARGFLDCDIDLKAEKRWNLGHRDFRYMA